MYPELRAGDEVVHEDKLVIMRFFTLNCSVAATMRSPGVKIAMKMLQAEIDKAESKRLDELY